MPAKNVILLVALVLLLAVGLFAQTQWVEDQFGARPLGMGRAFVAVADDGNAPYWNPGALDFGKERILTGMFSRLFLGIDGDNIGEGYLSYMHHFDRSGSFGLSSTYFFSNIWREYSVNLSYARNIGRRLGLGINGRLLVNQVSQNNISYTEQPGHAENHIVDPRDDPFFSKYGWNKMGFTGGIGLMYKANRSLSFGLNAQNVNQPNMSFQGISGDEGKIPMTIRFGTAYTYHGNLTFALDGRFTTRKINDQSQIKPFMGAEYWLVGKTIGIRTGGNLEEFSAGFSYRSRRALDMQIDYAFLYPLTKLHDAGVTSHKLSATLRFLPPPKPLFDLALYSEDMSIYPKNAIIGETITIKATVKNLGERPVSGFSVSLYYQDPEKGWVNAAAPQRFTDKLGTGESTELTFQWVPENKGHYQFFAAVDDDGTMIPDLHGEIREIDEENNKGSIECDVFPLPTGTVSPLENTLQISQLTLVREEEPIVPIIFFKPQTDRVDDRFQHLIDVLSERLKKNPDIHLTFYGYYNPESEAMGSPEFGEKLALNRAKAVRSVFIKWTPEIMGQLHIADPTTYDASFHRTGLSDEHLEEDVSRVEEENRRVEIRATVTGFEKWDVTTYFDKGSEKVNEAGLSDLRAKAGQIQQLMERNPELIFLVEGYVTKDEANKQDLSFNRAYNIKKALGDMLGQDFVRRFSDRIFIKGNSRDYAEQGKAVIGLSGESLIFRPLEGTLAAKGYELNRDRTNFVNITSNVEAGVAHYEISIVGEDGELFRKLAEGKGDIPKGVPWDWKDESGNLINPTKHYFCKLDIEDKLGQKFTTLSDTIRVNVSQREQMLETMVIVEFFFNQDISRSKFLESRVEYVARKFIEKALEPKKKLVAVVSGHTDVIGMDYRNRQLSDERAKAEYGHLRRYLRYLLGLSSDAELNRWLRAHNTEFSYKGYADTKPYVVDLWRKGKLVEKNVGDNKLPEGRTLNRRVIIEFYTDKGEAQLQEKAAPVPPQSSVN